MLSVWTMSTLGLCGKELLYRFCVYLLLGSRKVPSSRLNPLPEDKILDRSKLKQSADDNFKFDENSRQFFKQVENTVGKGETLFQAISPFPTVFSKGLIPRCIKRCHCVGMG